ncbi:alpha/beta hydrolase [Gordonia sp. TBRC 11910]|uniref:Alpha/beta hydrolase n=1 Tax=Gordonia asplenii TaxID=2725283 RepID=A0A848L2H3_9ACTN|nr:alpha/beta hydrolase [Gordonia asplenii]NMO04687.1 alpha/beta hydrolase [Gordonia asplenii]
MPNSDSSLLANEFRALRELMAADPAMELEILRALFEQLGRATAEPTDVTYSEVDAGGVNALWCLPVDRDTSKVLVYTHGGGAANTASSHRKFAAHLAKASGAAALVVDFRRAPEHPFPAQIEDATTVYDWLLEQNPTAAVAVVGDSAGGNVAIGSVLRLRELGRTLPQAVAVFSPFLDMENTGATLDDPEGKDVFIDRGLVELMSALLLGADSTPTDPIANPLHADLTGFPPTYVAVGGAEALLDDSRRFVDRARATGVEVEFEIAPEEQHIYMFAAGRDATADATVKAIGDWLRATLDRPHD